MDFSVNPAEDLNLINLDFNSKALISAENPSLSARDLFFERRKHIKMPSEKVLNDKKAVVAALVERLKGAQAGVIADYRGLTVAQDTELRKKLREAGVEYTIVKNTLTRFAANKVGLGELDPVLHGPSALATSTDDVVAPAKVLVEFAKDNEQLEIKAGFVDGKVIDVNEVKVYASIPSKEVLISKMLGSLQAPIGKLVRTLDAVAKKDEAAE